MIEKTRKILTAIISAIVIIGVVYGVFALIINIFKEPDILTKDEIALHMIEENLVTNYTTFYFVSDCLDNLVEGAKRGLYNQLYEIHMKDYKKVISKEAVYAELKEFSVNGAEYSIKAVYEKDGLYIVEYNLNGQTKTMLMSFESKSSSYEFAIAK